MDIVYIRNLVLEASVGIYDWEKAIKQKVRLNLEMAWDNAQPAHSNRIEDCLNYKTVAEQVIALLDAKHYDLVEELAEDIAAMLIRETGTPWLKVTVGKPVAVKQAEEVGVQIERGQRP